QVLLCAGSAVSSSDEEAEEAVGERGAEQDEEERRKAAAARGASQAATVSGVQPSALSDILGEDVFHFCVLVSTSERKRLFYVSREISSSQMDFFRMLDEKIES
ncbi:unnamed protein product, partial [Timema podura]|nr:unnamed protein product [Timema podura]